MIEYNVKQLKRGEVYYVRNDQGYGYEQAFSRPAIIVSSDTGLTVNQRTVMVVFVTSNVRKKGMYVVPISSTKRESVALCNEVTTLDRRKIEAYLCTLTDDEMERVDASIKNCLGLETLVEEPENEEPEEEYSEADTNYEDMEFELAMYKRLYEKAMDKVIELQFNSDTKSRLESKTDEKKTAESVPYDLVNVNTATVEEISLGSGMSKQTAAEIVSYRKRFGSFKKLDDLLKCPRFGSGCMKKYGRYLAI